MKKCNCSDCSVDSGVAVLDSAAHLEHEHDHEHHHEEGASCGCSLSHDHSGEDDCGCGHEHGEENLTTLRQDIIAVVCAALLMAASLIASSFAGFSLPYLSPILMVAATLVAGLPIFIEGIKGIFKLKFEELALMTVAVIAATILGEFFEAAMVTLLFRIGEILEDLAVARSQREVEAVTKIIPDEATLLLADGSSQVVPAKNLSLGNMILVKSGERLPVDCEIIAGESSIDASSLTGESLPRPVGPGDRVLSSSINQGGVLTCRTVSGYEDSAAAKIIEMVRDSSAKKGTTEKLISRFARVYTPIVMVLAILTAVLPPLLGFGAYRDWIMRALVFLVASCPCALVIATPLAFFSGIGASSKQGILVKGSRYLEALSNAKTVVFDKTGTLTTGKPVVTEVVPVTGNSREEILRLAAVCESASTHPLAQAVLAAYPGEIDREGITALEEVTAQGMKASLSGSEVLCGSSRLMSSHGIDLSGLPEAPLYVAKDGAALGAILITDRLRDDAAETIRQLGAMGVTRTVMLTGDAEGPAREIGGEAGVGEVFAGLLPEDKVARFEQIKSETNGSCVYVGDGINDSPVLARSDVGVAMGLASDAAMQAADMVLMSDQLSSLPKSIRIARTTTRLAKWIIGGALAIKLAVLVLAFFGFANMGLGVFADVGVTVLSVLAATLALRAK